MASRSETADQRRDTYGGLGVRNRVVGVLRVALPLVGVLVFVVLVAQIVLLNLGGEFSISRISVQNDRVTVETPRYSGVMSEGTAYVVSARAASAALVDPDVIYLQGTLVELDRPTASDFTVRAEEAQFQIMNQHVNVEGVSHVEDARGTKGTIVGMFIDWPNQKLAASGAVHIDYASGMTIDSTGMTYDPNAAVWTFSRATVTLPYTPGEEP